MSAPDSTHAALQSAGIAAQTDAPLVKRTWWRVGGPADLLVDCADLATLQTVQRVALRTTCPVFVLGNASNLLVSDAGIRGLVVRLTGALAAIEAQGDVLVLGGGVKMVPLVGRMVRQGWTGLEFMAGIPGTVGGAIRMNAGTRLGEVVDRLIDATVVHPDGSVETLPTAALRMAYRTAHLPPGAIVASARFRLGGPSPEQSAAHIREHLDYRARTQPIDKPTCGSTFRNPEGDHAGRLVEAAGLKGFTLGGARVSEKHANFIANLGDATATDIRRVIEHVQAEVERQFGVRLQREVHYAGDWSEYR